MPKAAWESVIDGTAPADPSYVPEMTDAQAAQHAADQARADLDTALDTADAIAGTLRELGRAYNEARDTVRHCRSVATEAALQAIRQQAEISSPAACTHAARLAEVRDYVADLIATQQGMAQATAGGAVMRLSQNHAEIAGALAAVATFMDDPAARRG